VLSISDLSQCGHLTFSAILDIFTSLILMINVLLKLQNPAPQNQVISDKTHQFILILNNGGM
jgi:hypothetical protein